MIQKLQKLEIEFQLFKRADYDSKIGETGNILHSLNPYLNRLEITVNVYNISIVYRVTDIKQALALKDHQLCKI